MAIIDLSGLESVSFAKTEYRKFFLYYLSKRLDDKEINPKNYSFNFHVPKRQKQAKFNGLYSFLKTNSEKLATGNPFVLNQVHENFNDTYGSNECNLEEVRRIIDYKFFTDLKLSDDYNTYALAKALNVRSCTYCNRVYTITHSICNEKVTRPQLDHWFPKDKFPLLELSFHNLIPSCVHCNSSVKKNLVLNLKEHTHPYVSRGTENVEFDYDYSEKLSEYKIKLKKIPGSTGKLKDTLETLKIDEVYDAHHYELEDLIKIKQAYSKQYLKQIKHLFEGARISDEEIYRLAFGTEYNEEDFHKRPMSKFKHDILKELGVIK